MIDMQGVLRADERVMLELRRMYRQFGYIGYKVGRFEEYDLYARNKSFLVSENVLTFTDTNGKLMALKPDITLSIIKNAVPSGKSVQKLYYNENVYRTSAVSHGFKEIMQTGLECIGYVDSFAESEVVMLAARSLSVISEEYILDISHMGLIEGMLDDDGIEGRTRNLVTSLVKSKNISEIRGLCDEGIIGEELMDALSELTTLYASLTDSLPAIEKYARGEKAREAYEKLCDIEASLEMYGISDKVFFDFSVMNDCNYYDGIIFKGFISGIPDSVLSGGRYDRLVKKMGKRCSAIGFAVYLDRLERFGTEDEKFDVDVLLIYDEDAKSEDVASAARMLGDGGKRVKCAREKDGMLRYRRLVRIGRKGVEILETND